MKKKGGKAHINTTDNEKGEITADTTKIKKRIISVYHMIYIPIKWKTCKKWENPLQVQLSKIEPGITGKYKQINHK